MSQEVKTSQVEDYRNILKLSRRPGGEGGFNCKEELVSRKV